MDTPAYVNARNQYALLLAAVVILVVVLVYSFRKRMRAPSLYERLGGVYPIAAVIDRFSDALLTNPVVGVNSLNPQLRQWSRDKRQTRLPGLKFMRTLWVCDITGGPFKFRASGASRCPFAELNLANAHDSLKISFAEFDAVAAELGRSLDYYKVPAQEKSEVLAAFARHKHEVVSLA